MNKKRILLVEDDPLITELYLERFKEEDDISLISVSNGEEALKVASAEHDLILLDILLPKINGFEVLRKLKQNPPTRDVPVIILTNLGSEQTNNDKELALSLGAVDYLVKSYHTPDELIDLIRRRLFPEERNN